MQQLIDFIAQYTIVTDEEKASLLQIIQFSTIKKNELLIKNGAINDKIAFILKGSLRVYYIDQSGVEKVVGFLFENDIVTDFNSLSSRIPTSYYCETMESTDLIYISNVDFFNFIKYYPKYETILWKIMIKAQSIESEYNKVLRVLSVKERYTELSKLRPEVIQRVPVKYIASYLDMAFETLSRVRAGKL